VFHIFGALAEFDRNLIRERTYAGLAAARARGRKGGRRQSLVRSSVPWPSICTVRRGGTQLTRFAKRLASRGRRFTSMLRRLALNDIGSKQVAIMFRCECSSDARFSAARRAQVTCDGPDGLSGRWSFSLHIGIRSTTSFVTFLCRRSCVGITMASQVLHVLPRAVVLPRNAAVYELT
jgi:hypothetical protein